MSVCRMVTIRSTASGCCLCWGLTFTGTGTLRYGQFTSSTLKSPLLCVAKAVGQSGTVM